MKKQTQNQDDAPQSQKSDQADGKVRATGISEAALRGASQGARQHQNAAEKQDSSPLNTQPPRQQDQADDDFDQEWRRAGGGVPPHPGSADLPDESGPRDTAS